MAVVEDPKRQEKDCCSHLMCVCVVFIRYMLYICVVTLMLLCLVCYGFFSCHAFFPTGVCRCDRFFPTAAPWSGWGVPSPSVTSDLPSSAYGGHGHLVVALWNLVHQLIWWQRRWTLSQAEATSSNFSLFVSLWLFLTSFNPLIFTL